MENRKEPRAPAPRSIRFSTRGLAAAAAMALAVGVYWFAPNVDHQAPGESPPHSAMRPADAALEPSALMPAVIVVEDAPADALTPFSPSETEAAADDVDAAASPFAGERVARSAVSRADKPAPVQARRPATAAPQPATPAPRSDLFAALLQNIEQPAAASSGNRPTPMDELVQQLRRDDMRARAGTGPSVQAQLRACPKANTVQGLRCRQDVCARLTGMDPACPAPQ